MISRSAGLAVLTLALTACSVAPAASQDAATPVASSASVTSTGTCTADGNSHDYSLSVTASLPAGDTRVPALSWDQRPDETPTTSTLQRTIRACDDTSLSADFRDSNGTVTPARPLQIKSETLDSAAGSIQVVGPADNKASCEDVSVSSGAGSCAEPRGWFLTFLDPKPGAFQLQAPVDFGDGIKPSTLTIVGTVTSA